MPLYAYLGSLDGRTAFLVPQPLFNVLNGGKHASGGIDIQECMLAPLGFASIGEKVDAAKKCMAALQASLQAKGRSIDLGDEGGFAPALDKNEEALDLLVSALAEAGHSTSQVRIALDVAATSFYAVGVYAFRCGTGQAKTREEMLAWYEALAQKYPLISIEDPFQEDDFGSFAVLTKRLGTALSIVGDDLTVTNTGRIEEARMKQSVNACIIKPNQIGTVTEAIEAVKAAKAA